MGLYRVFLTFRHETTVEAGSKDSAGIKALLEAEEQGRVLRLVGWKCKSWSKEKEDARLQAIGDAPAKVVVRTTS